MNTINSEIAGIWCKYNNEYTVRAPLFYPCFNEGGFLGIGLNPSFDEKYLKRIFELEKIGIKEEPEDFFNWKRAQENIDKYIEKNVKMEEIARGKNSEHTHKFYKPFFEVAKEIKICPVQVIDMFLVRETSQKKLEKAEVDKDLKYEFWKEQFCLFLKIIENVNPRIILVADAFASKIFKEKCSNQLSWREDKGYHILKLNKVSCPIFFSGMLSGQRALDTGSKERLIWHMGKAIQRNELE